MCRIPRVEVDKYLGPTGEESVGRVRNEGVGAERGTKNGCVMSVRSLRSWEGRRVQYPLLVATSSFHHRRLRDKSVDLGKDRVNSTQ